MNSKNIGIIDKELHEIISVFEAFQKVKKVVLFGSRAKGNYTSGSDIDICMYGSSLTTNDIIDISIEIDKLEMAYKFDLLIYGRITEDKLIEHIDRLGICLFERE